MKLPPVVSPAEWQVARDSLLVKEKEARAATAARCSSTVDFGVSPETPRPIEYQDGEMFGLSVFLRDGDAIFHSYFTSGRGVEALGSNWTFLDLTPLGRQEDWEQSPDGWPQTPRYEWGRHHDRYEEGTSGTTA